MFYDHFYGAKRPPKVMKQNQRWNTLLICQHRDSNSGGSNLWSNALPTRARRASLFQCTKSFSCQGHNPEQSINVPSDYYWLVKDPLPPPTNTMWDDLRYGMSKQKMPNIRTRPNWLGFVFNRKTSHDIAVQISWGSVFYIMPKTTVK